MRVAFSLIVGLSLLGCASVPQKTTITAPSTVAVKTSISQASNSITSANNASQQSSNNIKATQHDVQVIDDKAVKALELLQ